MPLGSIPLSNAPLALLELGHRDIGCAIVDAATGRPHAVVAAPSMGIQAGQVRDMRNAHGAIVRAIVDAERMAGLQATAAVVAVTGAFVRVDRLTGDVVLDPPIATDAVCARLYGALRGHSESDGRVAIHYEPPVWRLDGRAHVAPPVEKFGRNLELDFSAVTMDGAPLRRLLETVEATDLPVVGVVPAGLAALLGVTTADVRQNGIAVVDIGDDQSTVAVHAGGRLTLLTSLAIGMAHVCEDVAAALHVDVEKAERIIRERGIHCRAPAGTDDVMRRPDATGTRLPAGLDEHSSADVEAPQQTRRLDVLLRLLADRLDAAQADFPPSGPVILVGCGSDVPGLAAYAAHVWARRVQVGQPVGSVPAGLQSAVLAGLAGCLVGPVGVRFDRAGSRRAVASLVR